MRARGAILVALAAVCALVASTAVVASAEAAYLHAYTGVSFGPGGPGSGTFVEVDGIWTDAGTGDVYVLEGPTIYRFDASGKPVNFSALGSNALTGAATPEGEFSTGGAGRIEVAIDASGGPAKGDIYVTSRSGIYVFDSNGVYLGELRGTTSGSFEVPCGVATDSAGSVYVADALQGIDKFSPHANLVTNADYVSTTKVSLSCEIAVDGLADVYAKNLQSLHVTKFNASGESAGEIEGANGEVQAIATNVVTNEVYFDYGEEIVTFDSAGAPAGPRFVAGPRSLAVAVGGATGDVYASKRGEFQGSGEVDIFNSLTLADAVGREADFASETTAVGHGSVNPGGVAVTGCVFEYGETNAYGSSVPCDSDPGSGSSSVPVTATLTGLVPGTHYHFRLAVSNANGTNYSGDREYVAPSLARVGETWISNVSAQGATLSATLNPGAADTTYRFEYGDTGAYGTGVPLAGGDAGAGLQDTTVSVHLQGLQPETEYHFRVVASNLLGTVESLDGVFRTSVVGGLGGLPDGRQWEMVSPPVKDGAQIDDLGSAIPGEGVMQAAEDGSAITYLATAPVGAPSGNADLTQLLSRRSSSGWSTSDITTPNEAAAGLSVGLGHEYRFFTPDLSEALVEPRGDTPLTVDASGTTLYLRDNASGSYRALATTSNVPANVNIGPILFRYATSDLSHVVFALEEHFGSGQDLYEWVAGHLELVSVLPDGTSARRVAPVLGGHNMRNAVADDGTRIFWTAERTGHLYMRDTVKGSTIQVDAAQGAPETEGAAHFQMASADGSRVFFSDSERLTADSTAGPGGAGPQDDLYEFDVATGKLVDLTVDGNPGESADVLGDVIGASVDDSSVYFVARGVLASGATAGAPNLYLLRRSGAGYTTSLVATLTNEDENDWGSASETLLSLTARVSGDGRYMAFMSDGRLTGYDNKDVVSGQPDEEVYLYDAEGSRVTCVSCNPTGERPSGIYERYGGVPTQVDELLVWNNRWFAANIPGWERMESGSATYQSRYLSDDGRLFFNSSDALVPQDTNGREDVYEYEPDGVGGCVRSAGCVALVSTGTSGDESAFVDASATGDDVFFRTTSRLVSSDFDKSYDMYDAHVCSTGVSCFAAGVEVPPACTSGDSCKASPSLQPALFGAPASATFSGAGNVTAGSAKTVVTRRSSGNARKLAGALRRCRQMGKHKRLVCERRARKRYGANAKGSMTIARKGR